MNVTLLKNVVDAVVTDNRNLNLVQLLAALENAYAQSVASPTPQTAVAFSTAKQALETAAQSGQCALLSPSRNAILEKLGVADLCGSRLVYKIDSIITLSAIPASVVQGLQELRTRATEFYQTADALRGSLDTLKIVGEKPPTDAAEVEVRLPFALFEGSLGGLAKEIKVLDRVLLDIVEAVSGERPPIKVRTLSDGSVEIFLTVDPLSGVAILTLVTAIVNLINSVMQTRKTRTELEKAQAPQEVLDGLIKWEQNRVTSELDQLRDKLLKESTADKGRKNELKKALSDSLKQLANRIDRGMDIEVATLLGEATTSVENSTSDMNSIAAAQQQIVEAMRTRKLRSRSDQPILSLPSLADEEEPDKLK